jgi:hypothetical protein
MKTCLDIQFNKSDLREWRLGLIKKSLDKALTKFKNDPEIKVKTLKVDLENPKQYSNTELSYIAQKNSFTQEIVNSSLNIVTIHEDDYKEFQELLFSWVDVYQYPTLTTAISLVLAKLEPTTDIPREEGIFTLKYYFNIPDFLCKC